MGGSSIQLARLFGIRIGASPSWFIVLFVMIYALSGYFRDSLAGSSTQAFLIAVLAAALFFASLVLHELGHALVARRNGITIAGIDLWFFGGVARLGRDSNSPGEEFRVAAAGPAVTLVIALAAAGIAVALGDTQLALDAARFSDVRVSPGLALLAWLSSINLFLLVFNLVPAFPLDGGRIARAIAWRLTGDKHRGTRIAGRMGIGFSTLLIGFGIFVALRGDAFNGIWFGVLGWFLGQGARGAVAASDVSESLDGVTAADLMDAAPVSLPATTPVARARDEYFERYRWPWFPVVDPEGRFVGILDEGRLEDAVTAGGSATAGEAVGAEERGRFSVAASTPLEALLGSEPLSRLGALMVVDGQHRLIGVVTVEQVRRALAAAAPTRS